MQRIEPEYAGFWARVGAAIIDTVLIMLITLPILTRVYGSGYFLSDKFMHGPVDFLLSWVFPAVAIILFWMYRQATPGKLAIRAKIVDAATGEVPTTWQWIVRYLGYFVSTLPLLLGLIWVAFDQRKQGWHDKLAGTVVIYSGKRKHRGTEPWTKPQPPSREAGEPHGD